MGMGMGRVAEISLRWFKILLPGLHGDQEPVPSPALGAGQAAAVLPGSGAAFPPGTAECWGHTVGRRGAPRPGERDRRLLTHLCAGTHTKPYGEGQESRV